MPYLNWKEAGAQLEQKVAPHGAHGGEKQHLMLSFTAELRGQLLAFLRETFEAGAGKAELRLDLPHNWIVFWKLRDGESRLLIAHPQPEEWVATAALTESHGSDLIQRLEALQTGQSLVVGELAPTGSVSNVEISLLHL
jgi:hypothetical protein